MLQDRPSANRSLPWRLITPVALVCGFLAACGGGDADATTPVADPQVAVGGSVDHPASYTVAQLKAQAPVTQTVTFASGTTPQTHTYTGASLWTLLDTAAVKVTAAKNDILNKIVVATGADGYRSVFSLGELKPDFGNRGNIVAYEESIGGVATPLTSDGSIRVTAPADVKGGRYVSALVRLDVQPSASTQAGTGGGVSTQFSVSGAVARPGTFNLAALQALPAVDKTLGANTYRGVSLWTFLNTTIGITTNSAVKNDILNYYVVATGSDGYQTAFALGEINPDFGNQPDLIAYQVNGTDLGTAGFARTIVPNDVKAGRWVSNLISLEVFKAP